MTAENKGKVGIIGCGNIGHSFAVLFAGAGYRVVIFDIDSEKLVSGLSLIERQFEQLKADDLLGGSLTIAERMQLISTTPELSECIKDAQYIQECVLEDLNLKIKVFTEIDAILKDGQILASSTSAIIPSKFMENLTHRENCLVSHPVNPPIYCPLVELVPSPWTKPETVDKTHKLLSEIGMSPIRLNRETAGFCVNRLQWTLLAEAWRLVQEGVCSATDVNKVVSQGLGLRWAFLGPLEVSHLNADGIAAHNARYGPGIEEVLRNPGPKAEFLREDVLGRVAEELERVIPLDKLAEHRAWRDKRLSGIAKLKKQWEQEKPIGLQ